MKQRIIILYENIRENFWFIPSLMLLGSIFLSLGLVTLDTTLSDEYIQPLDWIYTGGAEGARALLSTVATSMMNVAGVTFSITIVVLSIASSTFGHRLLRNFMRDRGNQLVLGTFVSTFVYCLLVLRTIRSAEEVFFVPYISVTAAIGLAIINIGVLIYFINHVSNSVNADNVISSIEKDINNSINRMYPDLEEEQLPGKLLEDRDGPPQDFEMNSFSIESTVSGYVQGIDYDDVMNAAVDRGLIVDVKTRPGRFIGEEGEMMRVWPAHEVDEDLIARLQEAVFVGPRRIRNQDVEYAINQLVEIAVRALSPSLNDPFTAMYAIDRLAATLSNMAERTIPTKYRYDEEDKLRLIINTVTFEGAVNTAFNQIRQYGRSSVSVTIRLLEALAIIANQTNDPNKHEPLRRQAELIWASSQKAVEEEEDLKDIKSRYHSVLAALAH